MPPSEKDRVARSATTSSPSSVTAAVSLKTVAQRLGLSVATVSRVLSGAPAARSIPKSTQERIFAAAKQFNYRPNVLARCDTATL